MAAPSAENLMYCVTPTLWGTQKCLCCN